MQTALAATTLKEDLTAADGRVVASGGEVVDLAYLRRVAACAPAERRSRPLHETSIADAVLEALEAPALLHVVSAPDARGQVADALADVRFPEAVWDELEQLRGEDPSRFQHAIWTALVSARLFRTALGDVPGIARFLGGALVHDLGMRHAPPPLRDKRGHLTAAEARELEEHPLLGAVVLASALGDAPAVHLALLHHLPCGGTPGARPPEALRALDLISVSSAFAAMVASRSFRPQPFSPRGAVDQLLEEAQAGLFDERAVRLLVFCLRGAKGSLQQLRLPHKATGFRPPVNHHGLARQQLAPKVALAAHP